MKRYADGRKILALLEVVQDIPQHGPYDLGACQGTSWGGRQKGCSRQMYAPFCFQQRVYINNEQNCYELFSPLFRSNMLSPASTSHCSLKTLALFAYNIIDTFAKEAHDSHLLKPPHRVQSGNRPACVSGNCALIVKPTPKIDWARKEAIGPLASGDSEPGPFAYIEHYGAQELSGQVCFAPGSTQVVPTRRCSRSLLDDLVNSVAALNEALTGSERVRDTPLPEAYSIAISQISCGSAGLILLPTRQLSEFGSLFPDQSVSLFHSSFFLTLY